MMLLVGVLAILKVVCEKYLALVNGCGDDLLVTEVRRVADRRKNDMLMDDLRYFNVLPLS
jgi:hypothetical protein